VLVLEFRIPQPNTAPAVSAGPDLAVVLPAGATLDGSVLDDGQVQATPTTTWSTVSGPGVVTFGNPGLVDTTATFSQPGSYTLRLTADDGELGTSDDVVVEVWQRPLVSAGPNRRVRFPAAASLDGTLLRPGYPGAVTFRWTKVSGPGTVTFANRFDLDTRVTVSRAGNYTLRLTATNSLLSGFDDVVVKAARR